MREAVDPAVRARAVRAAQGLAPFDLLLAGGVVVDVMTGRLRDADVGIVGPLIAGVVPRGSRTDALEVVDATGCRIAPGFIDMHVHFESSMLTPAGYAQGVLPRGTTTVFADPHELGNVAGMAGMRYAVEASRGLPMRFLFQAPSCVPPVPELELSGAEFRAEEVAELLSWPEIRGVAEVMDSMGVLEGVDRMTGIVGAGLASGKLVSGHAAGLSPTQLEAYLAAGIDSDHELFGPGDFAARLDAGMTAEVRAAIPDALPSIVETLDALPELPTAVVGCTDDVFASTMADVGAMDEVVRQLIAHGLPPIRAYRIAGLHGAVRLGREDLGRVNAGARADLLVLSSLEDVAIRDVLFAGRRVVIDGALAVPCEEPACTPPLDTVQLEPTFTALDFAIRTDRPDGRHTLKAIGGAVITAWDEVEVDVVDGEVRRPEGCILQAVVHRYGRAPAEPRVVLATGWEGRGWRGAIATTVSHDTHNLVVFGVDAEEMALAANEVVRAGGGVVVVSGGAVLARIDLPIAGILSPAPFAEVAARQRELQDAAFRVGMIDRIFTQPLMQLFASSLACLPGPHVTDLGVGDSIDNVLHTQPIFVDRAS